MRLLATFLLEAEEDDMSHLHAAQSQLISMKSGWDLIVLLSKAGFNDIINFDNEFIIKLNVQVYLKSTLNVFTM